MGQTRRSTFSGWRGTMAIVAAGLIVMGTLIGLTWNPSRPAPPKPLTLSAMSSSAVIACQNIANDNWVGYKGTMRCAHDVSRDFLRLADTKFTTKQLHNLNYTATNCANNATLYLDVFETCMYGATSLAGSS